MTQKIDGNFITILTKLWVFYICTSARNSGYLSNVATNSFLNFFLKKDVVTNSHVSFLIRYVPAFVLSSFSMLRCFAFLPLESDSLLFASVQQNKCCRTFLCLQDGFGALKLGWGWGGGPKPVEIAHTLLY